MTRRFARCGKQQLLIGYLNDSLTLSLAGWLRFLTLIQDEGRQVRFSPAWRGPSPDGQLLSPRLGELPLPVGGKDGQIIQHLDKA
jgi:hypothetical protein